VETPFIDRRVELAVLEREWRSRGTRLVIVYGRRRTGKTRLLREWCRGRRCVYFLAAEVSYQQLSTWFSQAVGEQLAVYVPPTDLLEAITRLAKTSTTRTAVILDEFQYIVEADKSTPSRLQKLLDEELRETSLVLVLSGSAISFFQKELLGYRAPLFGRRTAQIKLKPMRYGEARGFYNKMPPEDAARAYSILGGTPAYAMHAYNKTLDELLEELTQPGHPLQDEALALLRQELREPRSYAAILAAVSQGKTRPAEAAQQAGIDPRTIHRYIEVLDTLDILEKKPPLGARRGARLRFKDPYFHAYFKLILPALSLIEAGHTGEAKKLIEEKIDQHTAQWIPRILEQHAPELHRAGLAPRPAQLGPWWHRDTEIDLVIRDPGKETLLVEAKWSNLTRREAERELNKLEAKAEKTGLLSPINTYMLVARRIEGIKCSIEKEDHRVLADWCYIDSIVKHSS